MRSKQTRASAYPFGPVLYLPKVGDQIVCKQKMPRRWTKMSKKRRKRKKRWRRSRHLESGENVLRIPGKRQRSLKNRGRDQKLQMVLQRPYSQALSHDRRLKGVPEPTQSSVASTLAAPDAPLKKKKSIKWAPDVKDEQVNGADIRPLFGGSAKASIIKKKMRGKRSANTVEKKKRIVIKSRGRKRLAKNEQPRFILVTRSVVALVIASSITS